MHPCIHIFIASSTSLHPSTLALPSTVPAISSMHAFSFSSPLFSLPLLCFVFVCVGKRRYDRKQAGYGGQTKPIFHKKVKTTKKVVLKMKCGKCSQSHQIVLKRSKHFELGGQTRRNTHRDRQGKAHGIEYNYMCWVYSHSILILSYVLLCYSSLSIFSPQAKRRSKQRIWTHIPICSHLQHAHAAFTIHCIMPLFIASLYSLASSAQRKHCCQQRSSITLLLFTLPQLLSIAMATGAVLIHTH